MPTKSLPKIRIRGSAALLGVLLLLWALAACSSSDGDGGGGTQPPPPPPETPDLAIHFSVLQLAEGGQTLATPRLLWKGTSLGPDADSPQRGLYPRVPGADAFRVEWELVDPTVVIRGFQYRVTNDPAEGDRRMPRDANGQPYWSDQTSFDYENSTPRESITSRCDTGGDCPEILLWSSDLLHSIWVFASTDDGQETPLEEAQLQWQIVNEAPTTELVLDATYPYYTIDDGMGGTIRSRLTEGDTIPAGAQAVFRLRGEDPDPVVLKQAALPRVRFQGRTEMNSRNGPPRQLQTNYSPPAETDTIAFQVGPFDYTFFGRAVDPLRAVDPTPASFSFHAGFSPRVTSLSPANTDEILLRDPSKGSWPENTIQYQVSPDTVLYWTGARFVAVQVNNEEQWVGNVFRIPLVIRGEGDPREPIGSGYGQARAFAYEWFGDGDPANTIRDGGGADDAGVFRDATAFNEYRLEGIDAVEIFVPFAFWIHPEYFDPGTCATAPGGLDYCGVGDLLRAQTGRIHLLAWARNTSQLQVFTWYQQLVEIPNTDLTTGIGPMGQVSAPDSALFPLHLGLDDGAGGVVRWP